MTSHERATSQERSRRSIGIGELAASLGVSPFEVLSSLGLDLGRIRKALQEHGRDGLDEAAALTALIEGMHLELTPRPANGAARIGAGLGAGDAEDAAAAASRQLAVGHEEATPPTAPPPAPPADEPPPEAVPGGLTGIEPSRRDVPPFAELLALLRSYRWTFAGVTLMVLAIAMALSLRTPNSYYAEAAVLVQPVTDPVSARDETVNMATQAELVQSNLIASRVVERLAIPGDPSSVAEKLSVSQPEDTEILELGYTAGSPQAAEERAQAFAEEYLAYRADQTARASASEQAAIEEEIATLQTRLDEINDLLGNATGSELARLETEANQLSSRIVERQLRLNAIRAVPTVGVVLRDAAASFTPVAPDHVQNGVLGLIVGLLLAGSMVLLRDRIDDRLHGAGPVAAVTGRPVVTEVPWHPRSGLGARSRLPALHHPDSTAAETYRALAVDLMASGVLSGRPLVVTGARRGSGATAVTANLGISLARTGRRVLLVDADVHDGQLARRFELAEGPGFVEVVTQGMKPSQVIVPTDVEHLDVLPAGRRSDRDAAALAPEAVRRLAERLVEPYDVVLFDAPAVVDHPDTVAVVSAVPDVLLAVASGTPRRGISFTVRALTKAAGDVQAVVLTKVGAAWMTADL